MGLESVVSAGVAIADSITGSLQDTVTHKPFLSRGVSGTVTYDTSVSRQAIVNMREKMLRDRNGKEILSIAQITFPRPVAITLEDLFTLPDGTEHPVATVDGLVDPSTSAGYMKVVELG